jgi:hypothetical protein
MFAHQGRDRIGMGHFLPHRGTVFAVEGDIEYAAPQFGRHLRLQLQAFAHALRLATEVIAHGQDGGGRLGAEQNVLGVRDRGHAGVKQKAKNKSG